LTTVRLEISAALADFADGITDERAGRGLARAIRGKGALRRLKDELFGEHLGLLPAWSAFRDARAGRRAVRWLADNHPIDDRSVTVGTGLALLIFHVTQEQPVPASVL
jgi:Uncharacterised protein family (UPF0158)